MGKALKCCDVPQALPFCCVQDPWTLTVRFLSTVLRVLLGGYKAKRCCDMTYCNTQVLSMDPLHIVLHTSSDSTVLPVQHKTPKVGISFSLCLLAELLPSASVLCVELLLSPPWSGQCLCKFRLISNLEICLL